MEILIETGIEIPVNVTTGKRTAMTPVYESVKALNIGQCAKIPIEKTTDANGTPLKNPAGNLMYNITKYVRTLGTDHPAKIVVAQLKDEPNHVRVWAVAK